jgi:hypothetical protein
VYGSDIEFLSSKTMNASKQRRKYYDIGYRSRNVLPYYLAFASRRFRVPSFKFRG